MALLISNDESAECLAMADVIAALEGMTIETPAGPRPANVHENFWA